MIDGPYLDPSLELDGIHEVAVAPEASARATAIGKFRSQGYRQIGRSELLTASAASAALEQSGRFADTCPDRRRHRLRHLVLEELLSRLHCWE